MTNNEEIETEKKKKKVSHSFIALIINNTGIFTATYIVVFFRKKILVRTD